MLTKTLVMDTRITMFRMAMRKRNVPETDVPTMVVQWCSPELDAPTCSSRNRMPRFKANASANTTLECPSENQKPTLSGRSPSAISLRVVLSMAEM